MTVKYAEMSQIAERSISTSEDTRKEANALALRLVDAVERGIEAPPGKLSIDRVGPGDNVLQISNGVARFLLRCMIDVPNRPAVPAAISVVLEHKARLTWDVEACGERVMISEVLHQVNPASISALCDAISKDFANQARHYGDMHKK